jgi:deoxyribodipyrimidine photo-lyase
MGRSGASRNRAEFLVQSLEDLRRSLIQRGGQLFVRVGDPVAETMKVASEVSAAAVFVSDDVSRYARVRQTRLAAVCHDQRLRLATFPGITVVPPGALLPAGGDHYRIFTPYWTRWRSAPWRPRLAPPRWIRVPPGLSAGNVRGGPRPDKRPISTNLPPGGEKVARPRAQQWLRRHLSEYRSGSDDLAANRTSGLSPYLHFGCLSPAELAHLVGLGADGGPFLRQLCWRDFHHQVVAAFPELPSRDYRDRNRQWRDDPAGLEAWRHGLTGIPIVDAGMRQLRSDGWMHNRARLIAASFLTRDLGIYWRSGAEHFMDWLVDADVANNYGNWQWVAGTGNDTRPNRRFNVLRQAHRYDPQGAYVRRYVPELSEMAGPAVHEPWRLGRRALAALGYPPPIIEPLPPT